VFACLYSLSTPLAALVALAETFTPRFDVKGPLVMLDVSGLSRLLGSFKEIGDELRRSAPGPVRIAIAPTQTAAALLALGRAGLTVVDRDGLANVLASLPVSVLGELATKVPSEPSPSEPPSPRTSVKNRRSEPMSKIVGEMWDALPYFDSTLERATDLAVKAHYGGGWKHPRDAHAASQLRPRRPVTATQGTEHPHAAAASAGPVENVCREPRAATAVKSARLAKQTLTETLDLLQTLRRWGIKTLGALAALPPGDVYERLGARGVSWQRLARGEETSPLVPWIPEAPFEAALELEWPIEGLEPLSFVLGRLLEPLSTRLEQADRGAAILHTHLRLVSKAVHARTLQLPAPMRDPKTLRTLVLLDLETNPPTAAVDEVRLLIEPTPARVVQWTLYERAQPSPEQTSTLLARLTALMGDGHVGSPQLVDSWKPGLFAIKPFDSQRLAHGKQSAAVGSALRRFRLPVPARVQVHEGRPVRLTTDRRGVAGGAIVQAAGPWRSSGEWWNDASATSWDRDEWDVAIADGTVYRLYVERTVGQWFLDGVVD
jgi:protein ImuB